jgi:DNA N-6-adenine-methyltransferase (Dam)
MKKRERKPMSKHRKNPAAARRNKLPVPRRGGAVVQFDPKKAFEIDTKSEALIKCAQKVRDWEALDDAVEAHIENQTELVRWWREMVTPRHRPGRGGAELSAVHRTIPMREAEKLSGFKNQKISKFGHWLEDVPAYRARLRGPSYGVGLDEKKPRGTQGTGENEWFTPVEYLELARQVLGEIDLDPASNAKAQQRVQAKKFFTKKDNGLKQEWRGNVYINPPYATGLIKKFVDKLVEEIAAGRVKQE